MRTPSGHQTKIRIGRRTTLTLGDILPEEGPMRMLIVGKTPALVSVAAGHYFQGTHGQFMWSELRRYGLLVPQDEEWEDDALVRHGFGITDVVKFPRTFGSEPEPEEYGRGWPAAAAIIERLRPSILFWPYKGALDKVLRHAFGLHTKAVYGFNPTLRARMGSQVFAFGMIGTPCRREVREASMSQLQRALRKLPLP